MQYPISFWIGFHLFVFGLLALDLFVFHRKNRIITFKKATLLSAFWIVIALLFNYAIYLYFGSSAALQFLTGYVIEKSLSIDNLFLFLVIFGHFKVPLVYQRKVLFWGIFGVFFFRITLILVGIALINLFHWMFYVLGALILASGIKLFFQRTKTKDVMQSRVFSWIKSKLPVAVSNQGSQFFVREKRRWKVTSLFIVLLMIELTDVVLALDSVPAIFAITTDPFIIYTSNILAILGLRSLYFMLAPSLNKLRYLKSGLALILVFIGSKMLLSDQIALSVLDSLFVIGVILFLTIIFSFKPVRKSRF